MCSQRKVKLAAQREVMQTLNCNLCFNILLKIANSDDSYFDRGSLPTRDNVVFFQSTEEPIIYV